MISDLIRNEYSLYHWAMENKPFIKKGVIVVVIAIILSIGLLATGNLLSHSTSTQISSYLTGKTVGGIFPGYISHSLDGDSIYTMYGWLTLAKYLSIMESLQQILLLCKALIIVGICLLGISFTGLLTALAINYKNKKASLTRKLIVN